MSITVERTPDGRRICVSREIPVSRGRAWDVLTDTDRWPAWGPSVRAVESSERYIQQGTTGRVKTPVGLWVPFEITGCADYRWTWRVARIPATGHRVDSVEREHSENEACRVVFEIPLLAGGYVPVCRRALERIESLVTGSASK